MLLYFNQSGFLTDFFSQFIGGLNHLNHLAIGGAIGGGAGAAIGNEIGGRDGAIIGGGLGGALGAAINTDDDDSRHTAKHKVPSYRYDEPGYNRRSGSRFCPPGQAKKGRC